MPLAQLLLLQPWWLLASRLDQSLAQLPQQRRRQPPLRLTMNVCHPARQQLREEQPQRSRRHRQLLLPLDDTTAPMQDRMALLEVHWPQLLEKFCSCKPASLHTFSDIKNFSRMTQAAHP